MNWFDEPISYWRWQGMGALPLHTLGYEERLRQLKQELSQVERPIVAPVPTASSVPTRHADKSRVQRRYLWS